MVLSVAGLNFVQRTHLTQTEHGINIGTYTCGQAEWMRGAKTSFAKTDKDWIDQVTSRHRHAATDMRAKMQTHGMEGFQISKLNQNNYFKHANKVRKACSDADRYARKYKRYKNKARYLARRYSTRSSSRHRRRSSLATLKALARMSTRHRRAALARMPPRYRKAAQKARKAAQKAMSLKTAEKRYRKNCVRAKEEEVDMKATANKIKPTAKARGRWGRYQQPRVACAATCCSIGFSKCKLEPVRAEVMTELESKGYITYSKYDANSEFANSISAKLPKSKNTEGERYIINENDVNCLWRYLPGDEVVHPDAKRCASGNALRCRQTSKT